MRVNRQRAGRVVTVVAPPLVTVALLAVLGVVLDWPVWFAILVGVAMAVLGGYLLAASRAALRLDGNERATWLGRGEAAAFLTVAMAAVVSAATMYWQWTVPDARHAEEMRGAADAAYTIAGLLTSMTPEGRDEYLRKLRPLVTDDVAQALRDKVLVPMPAFPTAQKGIVRSVGVEIADDGAAIAIAVVEPTPAPPPAGLGDEPSDIILWLLLARFEDRWVLANLAPLGVRPHYPG
jgi:hypothetical protein